MRHFNVFLEKKILYCSIFDAVGPFFEEMGINYTQKLIRDTFPKIYLHTNSDICTDFDVYASFQKLNDTTFLIYARLLKYMHNFSRQC